MARKVAVILTFLLLAALAAAQGSDDACNRIGGTCQYDFFYCGGDYRNGLCSGSASKRCCVVSGSDKPCLDRRGVCQEDIFPCFGGRYQVGLCAGSGSRKCCIKS